MVAINSIEEAAERISKASRIMVVGSSGGGKTTLSSQIAKRLGLTHISMDKEFFWLPGWVPRERAEQRQMISEFIQNDRWIMDGSNPSSFDLRLPRTDFIIWVRISRLICIWSVLKRVAKSYGKTRPDMATGCVEQWPDREFLSYIWNFEKHHAPIFLRNFELYGPHVPIFQVKSRAQASQLLDLVRAAH
ncbi:AAA family ATPase [Agrobacterium sp. rho-8.1]|nr:AAA family ATPase [Agrobacterium sp. rho-8.1]